MHDGIKECLSTQPLEVWDYRYWRLGHLRAADGAEYVAEDLAPALEPHQG
jgi:hypothetical protein